MTQIELNKEAYDSLVVPQYKKAMKEAIETPLYFESDSSFKVQLGQVGTPTPSAQMQYSIGSRDSGWSSYAIGQVVEVPSRTKVYFKRVGNAGTFSSAYSDRYQFSLSCDSTVECHGNIMSLAYESFRDKRMIQTEYQFCGLFYQCKALKTSPILPAVSVSNYCYHDMFYECTSLESAEDVQALDLGAGCCQGMFQGCTSLVEAPHLHARSLEYGCYQQMFYGCTSLKIAPKLPATSLIDCCYTDMFAWCTSLSQAPSLPAMSLVYSCYQGMFQGCTSLVQAPSLPAMSLASNCYQNMFTGCTSLSQAPSLPATSLSSSCYQEMFEGCTSLENASDIPTIGSNDHEFYYQYDGTESLTKVSWPSMNRENIIEIVSYGYIFGYSTTHRVITYADGSAAVEVYFDTENSEWVFKDIEVGG